MKSATSKIKSLRAELDKATENIDKANLLNTLSLELRDMGDYRESKKQAAHALRISKKIGFKKGIADGCRNVGMVYLRQGKYSNALNFFFQALKFFEKTGYKIGISTSYSNIGLVYYRQGNYPDSLKKQLQALKISQEIGYKIGISASYNNIGLIYHEQGNDPEALKNYLQALKINEEIGYKIGISASYSNIGLIYHEQGNYPEALKNHLQALKISQEIGDRRGMSIRYTNIGNVYFRQNNYPEALKKYLQALKISEETGYKIGISTSYSNIGIVYSHQGNYPEALNNLMRALSLSKGSKQIYIATLSALSDLYKKQEGYKKALSYYLRYSKQKDLLFNKEKSKQITEMQTRYETEKKEQQIKTLQKEKEIQKLKLAQQKAMEKERLNAEIINQQELRSRAILEAEEKERVRIARDLHDGVGQLLSAVKLNVSQLESTIEKTEHKKMFSNVLELIDDSCREVRQISHNMMPNALFKMGLSAAVRDFLNKTGEGKKLKIHFQAVNINERLESDTEIVLYRVIQELINNIIKHAGASTITVQLMKRNKELACMVEDNGKGFDTKNVKAFEGIGLKNIYSRITYLKGTVNFDSHPGRGTTVTIEIPLL